MRFVNTTRTGRPFTIRWRLRAFLCAGCGVRMPADRSGVLTLTDDRKLEWACRGCYQEEFRRAAT